MGAQVGILSGCQFASLDGLSYSNQGRNLKTWWNFEDFLECQAPASAIYGIWSGLWNGAGALAACTFSIPTRPGLLRLETGMTNAGYSLIYLDRNSVAPFMFSAGAYTFETDVYINVLSAVAEEYITRIGFGDSITGADIVDGAYFEYDRLTSANWLCCTANNSVRTKTDSLFPVAATTWIRLKIVVNAAADLVTYYINGVQFLTLGTNIPAARHTSGCLQIVKSAGVTNRDLTIDWSWLHIDLTASR